MPLPCHQTLFCTYGWMPVFIVCIQSSMPERCKFCIDVGTGVLPSVVGFAKETDTPFWSRQSCLYLIQYIGYWACLRDRTVARFLGDFDLCLWSWTIIVMWFVMGLILLTRCTFFFSLAKPSDTFPERAQYTSNACILLFFLFKFLPICFLPSGY